MIKRTVIAVTSFALYTAQVQAQFNWPAVQQQTKPWARWWWQGSAVTKEDLSHNMHLYQQAGLGGLEITPIYGVKGYEQQFIPFLSPQWVSMLQYTLQQAKKEGVGIDLANATGWPFGGPWVTEEDASKELFWKKYALKSGEQLTEAVAFVQEPLVRAEGKGLKAADLKQPVTANTNLQQLALDQVRFERPLPLTLLMAYDQKGNAVNITDKVDNSGKLAWTAPQGGNWQLYALFQGDHGKMVERAAPGGEGPVIDHFSKTALAHYLSRFDKAFAGTDVSGIRAFFNDSYEVDDARGQSNITPLLFDAFLQRRGYDLRNYLPALLGEGDKEIASRVLTDYRETISDLLLDNFTRPWHAWGASKGALIRNQSHGSPANILDLYAAVDIPETEGDDVLRFKFATSAAHVAGKPLVSSESATWLNDHFLSSLGNVKQAIDRFFVGGVNHIFYHGVNYSPQNAPWPGWLFYAAVHFQPTNPFWRHFEALNSYITRCQSFLQQGKPDNEILVYYPVYDSYADRGRDLLKHYDAMKPDFARTGFGTVSAAMLEKGYTFDFISDKQIQLMQPAGQQLATGGGLYKTLLLPDCHYIALNTFQQLVTLAEAGATIAVYKTLPAEVQGLGQLNERRQQLNTLLARLHFTDNGSGLKTAVTGKGKFVLADDITTLLQATGAQRETLTEEGLQFVRRKYSGGYYYFISNTGNKAIQGRVPLAVKAASAVLFNPMTQESGRVPVSAAGDGKTLVYLQLTPGESCILQTADKVLKGDAYRFYQVGGEGIALNGQWTIHFEEGGSRLPADIVTDKPAAWTTSDAPDVQAFSGIATYRITFKHPGKGVTAWRLELGKVHESAAVYVNGKKLGTLLGPDYSITIPTSLLQQDNKLEIQVANLMANRIIDMEKQQISYKIFYNINFPAHDKENRGSDGLFTTAGWKPLPSGLDGVVKLVPLQEVQGK